MATQNMMDEDHGRTLLSTTDVYIDRNHNFTTADNFICDYGQVLDLGHVEEADPDITTLTTLRLTVQPGAATGSHTLYLRCKNFYTTATVTIN